MIWEGNGSNTVGELLVPHEFSRYNHRWCLFSPRLEASSSSRVTLIFGLDMSVRDSKPLLEGARLTGRIGQLFLFCHLFWLFSKCLTISFARLYSYSDVSIDQ